WVARMRYLPGSSDANAKTPLSEVNVWRDPPSTVTIEWPSGMPVSRLTTSPINSVDVPWAPATRRAPNMIPAATVRPTLDLANLMMAGGDPMFLLPIAGDVEGPPGIFGAGDQYRVGRTAGRRPARRVITRRTTPGSTHWPCGAA